MSIVGMRNWMHHKGLVRWIMLGLAVVMAVGIAYMGLGNFGGRDQQQEKAVGGAMAKVGADTLDRQTFETLYRSSLVRMAAQSGNPAKAGDESRLEQQMGPFNAEAMRSQVLNQVINEMILVQAAKAQGISVSSRDVNSAIDEEVTRSVETQRAQFLGNYKGKEGDSLFQKELAKQGSSLDMLREEIRTRVEAQRDQVEHMLYVRRLMDKMKSSVDTSDKAVRASFDEVSYRRISISTKTRSSSEAEKIAKNVVDQLRKGGDFVSLAKQYSDDPSKATGGLTPAMPVAYVQNEILSALNKLKNPSDVTDPIRTTDAYQILKLESRQSKLPADFNDAKKQKKYKDDYEKMALYKLQNDLFTAAKANTKVEIIDPEMKAYAVLSERSGDQKATLLKAAGEYENALKKSGGDTQSLSRSCSQLAMLYAQLSVPEVSPKKADQDAYRAKEKKALDDALMNTESTELRLMLADLKIKDKKYEDAVKDLSYVDANAYNDPQAHEQLLKDYKVMKAGGYAKADELIAAENKWRADYDKQMAAQKAATAATQPAPLPVKGH